MNALKGITVLDLGQIYNGPYATFLMASAGARVIKVESLTGETLRGRGMMSSAAYPFAMLNQSKESITLNLKSDKGKQMFKDLVEKADVVLENFSPDTMERLGLGAKVLQGINPRIIYACGSGYGRSGPHRDYLAMDITVQAMSGMMSTTGFADMPPLKSGPAICDFLGGVHLYGAVVTALLGREKSGKGAVIDVAMQDAVFPTLATIIGSYYYFDRNQPPRTGNKHPALTMAPYNVYETNDGHVAIICIRDGHWRALAKAIDQEEMGTKEGFATMLERAGQMEEVDGLVTAWTSVRTKSDVMNILQKAGVPCAEARTLDEVLGDEHLHERGMLRTVDHPELGEIKLPSSPLRFVDEERQTPTLAPELGEHNQQVYSELLGLSAEELEALGNDGVI